MLDYWRTLRRFNRNARLYLITPVAIGISYYGLFVVLFNLYLLRLGYGPSFIGAVNAAGQVSFIVMSLPASALGRRWGSRKLIIAGIILYLLGFGLLPLAEFVPSGWQATWLFATFMLAFLGGPLYWVNSNTYLMGTTTPAERNHAFSVRTALFPLAGVAGSLVGGLLPGLFATILGVSLEEPAPYRYALFLGALLYLPALLAMLAAHDVDGLPEERAEKATGPAPIALIVPLVLVELLRMAGEVGTLGFFNVYLDVGLNVSTAQIGTIAAVSLLVSGTAALSTPLLAARIGNHMTVTLSMLGMALLLVPLALFPQPLTAALSYMAVMALAAVSNSAISVYRMEVVGAAWWALMAGAAVTGQGVGESGILFAGGYLIDGRGFSSYFLTVACLVFLGAVFFLLYFRTPRGELARPGSSEAR
ncbi:MAG: MFS transporter [Trueperaceae bacterium]|nr:MAG: MFS transporter [Trueperaceae bacterium]